MRHTITLSLLMMCGSAFAQYTASDVNCDGDVNSADVVAIYNTITNGNDGYVSSVDYRDDRTFTVNGVTFTMKVVEGGSFLMGDTPEQGIDYDVPVHRVYLDSYFIGETEVTNELWKALMGSIPSRQTDSDYPVTCITWAEIQDFLQKLNSNVSSTERESGKLRFCLPSEAQWEFAARGGNKSKGYKYSGSDNVKDVAWYQQNSNDTHAVRAKKPNELGLYDMSGNVAKRVNDWYQPYKANSVANPTGPLGGTIHTIRGGSYYNTDNPCRVACRSTYSPTKKAYSVGFRLALCEY